MRIGLQTWGTEGDFTPFLALAIGLRNAGHHVTLAYTSIDGKDYASRSDVKGIELMQANGNVPVSTDFNPYAIKAKPGSFAEYTELLKRHFEPYTEAMYTASVSLCQQNDLVIGHAVCHTLLTASQKFRVPRISLVLTPLVVRSNFVSPIGLNLGPILNAFLWTVGGMVSTNWWFSSAKKIRKREGLPRIKSLQQELFTSDVLTIVAASEALCERPSDWGKHIQQSGFLNLPESDSNWEMPADLKLFLNNGEPPVYMTFGSCMQFDLKESTELLIKAARICGKRVIIQSNWESITKPDDLNIYCIGSVPHSALFKHCSLVVHHGGAGTTQAALLAGRPSVVVAHGFDQVYWAKLLYDNGLGGKPLSRSNLSAAELAETIKTVLANDAVKRNAEQISTKMKNENGVSRAVQLIQNLKE